MSIYSGFSTRNQEAQYNRLIENLLILLQSRVLHHLKSNPQQADLLWSQKFSSIYSNMKSLELHKYLEPKLSESCKGLANYFSLDPFSDPILPDYEFQKPVHNHLTISKKNITTPRKKYFNLKPSPEKPQKQQISKYYGQIMDNFLSKPKSQSYKKKNVSVSIESQDFWLLDDNINLLQNEVLYP